VVSGAQGVVGGEGFRGEGAVGDSEFQTGSVEGPGVDGDVGLVDALQVELNGWGGGMGVDIGRARDGRLSTAGGEADEVHGLEEAVVEEELIFFGVEVGFLSEAVEERDVEAHVELFAQVFLALDFFVLEFVDGELGGHLGDVEFFVFEGGGAGGVGGEGENVDGDEEAGVGVVGLSMVGGGGPDFEGDVLGGFEDVDGEAFGVYGGLIVVEGPAGVVEAGGVDGLVSHGGEGFVADVAGELAGEEGVVVLGDEEELVADLAADHGGECSERGAGGPL